MGRRGCTTSGTAATVLPPTVDARWDHHPQSSGSLVPFITPRRSGADSLMALAIAWRTELGAVTLRISAPEDGVPAHSWSPRPTMTIALRRDDGVSPTGGGTASRSGAGRERRSASAVSASRPAADRRSWPALLANVASGARRRSAASSARTEARCRSAANSSERWWAIRRQFSAAARSASSCFCSSGHLGIAGPGPGGHQPSMHRRVCRLPDRCSRCGAQPATLLSAPISAPA